MRVCAAPVIWVSFQLFVLSRHCSRSSYCLDYLLEGLCSNEHKQSVIDTQGSQV